MKCKRLNDDKSCRIGMFPAPVQASQCASCNNYIGESRGLGDDVAKLIKKAKLDKMLPKSKDCGCGKRREKLNNLLPKKRED